MMDKGKSSAGSHYDGPQGAVTIVGHQMAETLRETWQGGYRCAEGLAEVRLPTGLRAKSRRVC